VTRRARNLETLPLRDYLMRTMRLLGKTVLAAALFASASAFSGCAEAPPRLKTEDKARRVAPIPACIMYLPPRKSPNAFIRQLREDQYWKLVFPSFDDQKMELANHAPDCTGYDVLGDWQLKDADPLRGTPLRVQEGDVVFGAGGDRLKVVWLRSHKYADGDYGGAISLVRTMDNFVESYGVGVLRGRPERMRLQLERMGPEVIITATDEGCIGSDPQMPCESRLQVFLPRHGRLMNIADIPLERRAFGTSTELGMKGKIEYRMTTAPEFKPGLIKMFEQVLVRDDRGRELRKAELFRIFTLQDDGQMISNESSLWPRIYTTQKPKPQKTK
jgi:hypothetical protein